MLIAAAIFIIALAYFTYCRGRYDVMDNRTLVAALIMCWTHGIVVGIVIGNHW
jgi:hypothetical protein